MIEKNRQLIINNLFAGIEGKEILNGVNLVVLPGELHAVMGPNGSGKSTLAYAVMGHPSYEVTRNKQISQFTNNPINRKNSDLGGKIVVNGINVMGTGAEERARRGMFLALQNPIAVPGVTVNNLLRSAYEAIYGEKNNKPEIKQNPLLTKRWKVSSLSALEFNQMVKVAIKTLKIDDSFLSRSINDGFSGGEKKKIEMLQALVLSPKYAFFDEIDTGLDVDALRVVAKGISELQSRGCGVVVITHYQRILKYLKPDFVHVFVKGRIVKTGTASLAKEIEKEGYGKYLN